MNKIIITIAMAVALASCQKYDDADINNRIDNIENEQDRQDSELALLKKTIEAIEAAQLASDEVIGVQPIIENEVEVGVKITFEKSEPIEIYYATNGSNGSDGNNGGENVTLVEQNNSAVTITIDGTEYIFKRAKTIVLTYADNSAVSGIAKLTTFAPMLKLSYLPDDFTQISARLIDSNGSQTQSYLGATSSNNTEGWQLKFIDQGSEGKSITINYYSAETTLQKALLELTATNASGERIFATVEIEFEPMLIPLDEISANNYPKYSDMWYISGDGSTDGVKAAVGAAAAEEQNISLTLLDVTSVGERAFGECNNLTAISLPMAQTIVKNAFFRCTNLTSISLPMAHTIGGWAFYGCTSLTSISMPKVEVISEWVFSECKSLTFITLPMAHTIGRGLFGQCTNLTSVSLPKVETIVIDAFWECPNLNTLTLATETKLISIESGAFDSKSTNNIALTTGATNTVDGNTLTVDSKLYTFKSITVQ